MVSRCYKCGNPVDIRSETERQRNAATLEARRQKAADPELKKKYSILYEAIQKDAACVYYSAGRRVSIFRGEDAWGAFVADVLDRYETFTCFWCRNCNFLHVANTSNSETMSVANQNDPQISTLFYLQRTQGACSADNWVVNFRCLACGCANNDVPATVSYDGWVNKKADPFLRAPKFSADHPEGAPYIYSIPIQEFYVLLARLSTFTHPASHIEAFKTVKVYCDKCNYQFTESDLDSLRCPHCSHMHIKVESQVPP